MGEYSSDSPYVRYTRIGKNVVKFRRGGYLAVIKRHVGASAPVLCFEFIANQLPISQGGEPVDLVSRLDASEILRLFKAPDGDYRLKATFLLGQSYQNAHYTHFFRVSLDGAEIPAIFVSSGAISLDDKEAIQFYEDLIHKPGLRYGAKKQNTRKHQIRYWYIFNIEELFTDLERASVKQVYISELSKAYRGYEVCDTVASYLLMYQAMHKGIEAMVAEKRHQTSLLAAKERALHLSFAERYRLFTDEVKEIESGEIIVNGLGNSARVKLPGMPERVYGDNETDFQAFLQALDLSRATDNDIQEKNLQRIVEKIGSL